jgi:hypothetical protein
MLGEVTQRDGEQGVVVLTRIRAQAAIGRCGQLPLLPIRLVDNRTLRPYGLTGRRVRLYPPSQGGIQNADKLMAPADQRVVADRKTHGRGET